MTDLANIKIVLRVEGVDKAADDFSRVDEAGKNINDELSKGTRKLSDWQAGADGIAGSFMKTAAVLTGVTAGLGVGLTGLVQKTGEFEYSLTQMSKVSSQSLAGFRESIQALPAELGNATELMQAQYQIMSAGITGATESMDMLVVSAKAAKAAGLSQADTIKALSKVMAGYAGDIKAASVAADLLFAIEKTGQTSFQELVPVIGEMASISKLAGVGFAEMGAALAAITQTAGSTGQAATQYKAIIMGMLAPTTDLSKVISALGYESGQAMMQQLGWSKTLDVLNKTAQASGIELSKLFGSSEALTGLAPMLADGFKKVDDNIREMNQAAGATDKFFSEYKDTLQGVQDTSSSIFSNLVIQFGEQFLPAFKDGLTDLNQLFIENSDSIKAYGQEAGELFNTLVMGTRTFVAAYQGLPAGLKDAAEWGLIGGLLFGKKAGVIAGAISISAKALNDLQTQIQKTFNLAPPSDYLSDPGGAAAFEVVMQKRLEKYNNLSIPDMVIRPNITVEPEVVVKDEAIKQVSQESFLPKGWADNLLKGLATVQTATAKTATGAGTLETALKTVNRELAKLGMTDAEFKQFELDTQMADLEKALGKAHPKVKALREELGKKLQADLFKDLLAHADPAQAKINEINKQYAEWVKTLESMQNETDPVKYETMLVQLKQRHAVALREVNTLEKQGKDFAKDTADLVARNSLTEVEYAAYVLNKKRELWAEELQFAENKQQLIDERMQAEIEAFNKQHEKQAESFGEAWKRGMQRVDDIGADMFKGFVLNGEKSLSNLLSSFKAWLAEMAYAATLRPIVVSVTGAVAGIFGGDSLALANGQAVAGGGGGGGIGAMDILSMFKTGGGGGWFADAINTGANYLFPGTFAADATMAEFNALAGSITGTPSGATQTFTSAAGPTFAAAGAGATVGGLVSPYVNKLLGIQNNKGAQIGAAVGGMGSTAVLTALAASQMWNPGGWVAAGIAALSSILGGSAGGLLGGGKRTRPSTYTGIVDMPLGVDLDYAQMFEQGAWYDRMDKGDSKDIFQSLGNTAQASVDQVKAFAALVPEEMNRQLAEAFASGKFTWSAGRGQPGSMGSWNFQPGDDLEERVNEAIADIMANVMVAFQRTLGSVDISQLGVDLDFSQMDWIEKGAKGLAAIRGMEASFEALFNPMSEFEAIVSDTNAKFDASIATLKEYGVSQWKIDEIEQQRTAVINKATEAMRREADLNLGLRAMQLEVSSEYLAATQLRLQQEDELTQWTLKFGKDSEYVAQLLKVQSLEYAEFIKMLDKEQQSFRDDLALRYAVLEGNDQLVARMQLTRQHTDELAEAVQKFGATSVLVANLLELQAAELKQLELDDYLADLAKYNQYLANLDAAKNAERAAYQAYLNEIQAEQTRLTQEAERTRQAFYSSLQRDLDNLTAMAERAKTSLLNAVNSEYQRLKTEADQATATLLSGVNSEKSRLENELNTAKNELIGGLRNEISSLEATTRAAKEFTASLAELRDQLFLDNSLSPLTPDKQTGYALADLQEVYARAAGGDVEAYSEFQNAAREFLQKSAESSGDFGAYTQDFAKVMGMINKLGDITVQPTESEAQLDLLQKELDALLDSQKTLDELRAQFGNANSALQSFEKIWAPEIAEYAASQVLNLEKLRAERAEATQQVLDFETVWAAELAEYQQSQVVNLEQLRQERLEADTALLEFQTIWAADLKLMQETQVASLQDLKTQMLEAEKRLTDFNSQYATYIGQLGTNIVNKLEELKQAWLAAQENVGNTGSTPVPKPTPPSWAKPGEIESGKVELPDTNKPSQPKTYAEGLSLMETLQNKAAAMNRGQTLAEGQLAGGWTAESVLKTIYDQGLTFQTWYEKFGMLEGFAKGGLPTVGAWALVGEQGPELVNFSQPARVYTASDTAKALRSGLDTNYVQRLEHLVSTLIEEVKTLRLQNNQLLNSIGSNTRETRNVLDKWDFDGTPEVRQ